LVIPRRLDGARFGAHDECVIHRSAGEDGLHRVVEGDERQMVAGKEAVDEPHHCLPGVDDLAPEHGTGAV
jgi:hypothetical protein